MRAFRFLSPVFLAAFVLISCDKEGGGYITGTAAVTFESAELPPAGYVNDVSYSENFATFVNNYDSAYDYWSGFAVSSCTDTVTSGYANQYSVFAKSGAAGSDKFGVCYYDGMSPSWVTLSVTSADMRSIYVNNSTYVVLDLLNGSQFSKKFEDGDWFKLTITGYAGDEQKNSVDFYLADFRDGKSYICEQWTAIDLSSLTGVNKIGFTLSSSDVSGGYINTPTYVCVDNLVYGYRLEY